MDAPHVARHAPAARPVDACPSRRHADTDRGPAATHTIGRTTLPGPGAAPIIARSRGSAGTAVRAVALARLGASACAGDPRTGEGGSAEGVGGTLSRAAGAGRPGNGGPEEGPTLGGSPLAVPDDAWTTLPAVMSVWQARRVGAGWVLLDGSARSLHVLADGASRVRTIAREGDGPGELRLPEALAVVGDTVWVARAGADRLDAFRSDGAFLRGLAVGGAPCPGGLLHGMASGPDADVLLAVQCIAPGGVQRVLGRVDTALGTTTWRPWEGAPRSDGVLSLDRLLVASAHGEVLMGRSGEPCLIRIAGSGRPSDEPGVGPASTDSLCVDVADPVPLSAALRDTLRDAFRPRARGLGLDFETPTHEPWLTGVVPSGTGWVALRPSGRSTVLEPLAGPGAGGRAADRLRLPPDATPFLNGAHLLLVRAGLEGTEAVRIPWPAGEP